MKMHSVVCRLTLAICLIFCLSLAASAQTKKTEARPDPKVIFVTTKAKGTFEVKVTPLAAEENVGDATIGRLSLLKTFSGDLAGVSKGQMLGSQSEAVAGSGGYVAMERFNGTLKGLKGSFTMQHTGTMQGGKFDLNVTVVPDSGTDDLKGISGTCKIIINGAKHLYEFTYSLPAEKMKGH